MFSVEDDKVVKKMTKSLKRNIKVVIVTCLAKDQRARESEREEMLHLFFWRNLILPQFIKQMIFSAQWMSVVVKGQREIVTETAKISNNGEAECL